MNGPRCLSREREQRSPLLQPGSALRRAQRHLAWFRAALHRAFTEAAEGTASLFQTGEAVGGVGAAPGVGAPVAGVQAFVVAPAALGLDLFSGGAVVEGVVGEAGSWPCQLELAPV